MTYSKEYYEVHKPNRGRKSIICKFEGCGKIFKRVQNFVIHLRVHLDIKHYEWEHWQKTFSQKGNLAKHVRKHEIPDLADRKQLICSVCYNLYTQKYNLRVIKLRICCKLDLCQNVKYMFKFYYFYLSK